MWKRFTQNVSFLTGWWLNVFTTRTVLLLQRNLGLSWIIFPKLFCLEKGKKDTRFRCELSKCKPQSSKQSLSICVDTFHVDDVGIRIATQSSLQLWMPSVLDFHEAFRITWMQTIFWKLTVKAQSLAVRWTWFPLCYKVADALFLSVTTVETTTHCTRRVTAVAAHGKCRITPPKTKLSASISLLSAREAHAPKIFTLCCSQYLPFSREECWEHWECREDLFVANAGAFIYNHGTEANDIFIVLAKIIRFAHSMCWMSIAWTQMKSSCGGWWMDTWYLIVIVCCCQRVLPFDGHVWKSAEQNFYSKMLIWVEPSSEKTIRNVLNGSSGSSSWYIHTHTLEHTRSHERNVCARTQRTHTHT